MKTSFFVSAAVMLAGSLLAADSSPKDDVIAAAKKLGDKDNYSWKTTVVVPENAQFRPGPTEGKTEKDGYMWVSMTRRDTTTQVVKKGEKAAVTNPDGEWQALSDMDSAEGRGRFLVGMVRNLKAPAAQAAEMAADAKEIKKDGEVWCGDLTEDGAKKLLMFRRGGSGDGPSVSGAKGSVKFWAKDGVLCKYEFKVSGTVTFNNNDMEVDRTTTVEIKDVGTTKVTVPDEAKKKLS
jgi:hypothetical protein